MMLSEGYKADTGITGTVLSNERKRTFVGAICRMQHLHLQDLILPLFSPDEGQIVFHSILCEGESHFKSSVLWHNVLTLVILAIFIILELSGHDVLAVLYTTFMASTLDAT